MARSILAGLAVLAGAASIATPAVASAPQPRLAKVVYGIAWADGPRTLRITPMKADPIRLPDRTVFHLSRLQGARELRFRYTGADFRRVTERCYLKENEGKVFLDRNGLGRTRCKDRHLDFVLEQGPVPVRITVGRRLLIQEFLAAPTHRKRAYGTLTRLNDNTVRFRTNGTTLKLGYSPHLHFLRVTRRCGDRWLANQVNASPTGLGTKPCVGKHFTQALRTAGKPVRVRIDYNPLWDSLDEVWEVAPR